MARLVTGTPGRVRITLRDLDLAAVDASGLGAGDVVVTSLRTDDPIVPDAVAGDVDGNLVVDLPAFDAVDAGTVDVTHPDGITHTAQPFDVVSARYASVSQLEQAAAPHQVDVLDVFDALEEVENRIVDHTKKLRHRRVVVAEAAPVDAVVRVRIPVRHIVDVLAVTITDRSAGSIETLTDDELAKLEFDSLLGVVFLDRIVYPGHVVTVTVEAGRDEIPSQLSRAAARAAVDIAKRTALSDGRDEVQFTEGGFPFSLASAKHGRLFGIDGVDDVIENDRPPSSIGGY